MDTEIISNRVQKKTHIWVYQFFNNYKYKLDHDKFKLNVDIKVKMYKSSES